MHRLVLAAAVALVTALPGCTQAQVMASEHGMVQQRVDGTTITIQYYRPERRGRDNLFGGVVKWGSTWTPGANWATTIDVDHDVKIDGHALAKGKYSIWMVPRQGDWTVIFSTVWKRFHVQGPDPSAPQVKFTVKPDSTPMVDVLTFSFPAVEPDATTLLFQWGTTAVQLHIEVPPSNAPPPPDSASEAGRRLVLHA
ncbi:MAG TPA: DUF2911 domain-containing protein [Gemmatimonadaceae bacterium]|jgi:hypothetical protein|nr:DUF2911 domain-containing protein [Gemmatimonadaceae bacterium]